MVRSEKEIQEDLTELRKLKGECQLVMEDIDATIEGLLIELIAAKKK
ncbi:MAG: hypothetical protein KAI67_04205 [Candidatus Pacebacteria bacterium]|nr:hypothetical protein [Candidatus Paceibacterota bacterium]